MAAKYIAYLVMRGVQDRMCVAGGRNDERHAKSLERKMTDIPRSVCVRVRACVRARTVLHRECSRAGAVVSRRTVCTSTFASCPRVLEL